MLFSKLNGTRYIKKGMDPVRDFLKSHQEELLKEVNEGLVKELWDKYCSGNISKWEMDSVSYYSHDHELKNVDCARYNFSDYSYLSENPELTEL